MKNLYQIALQTVSPIKLKKNGEAGHVGCALETVGGVVFTGICIDVPCSIGICAEQAAIAEMLKNRETKIKRIVAVYEDGSILPPCGRCRELMSQLDLYNENTMVVVDFEKEVRLCLKNFAVRKDGAIIAHTPGLFTVSKASAAW